MPVIGGALNGTRTPSTCEKCAFLNVTAVSV